MLSFLPEVPFQLTPIYPFVAGRAFIVIKGSFPSIILVFRAHPLTFCDASHWGRAFCFSTWEVSLISWRRLHDLPYGNRFPFI